MSETEVDAVIEEFDGNMREAIRALLHDIAVLTAGFASNVSRGYVQASTDGIGQLPASARSDNG